MENNNIRKQAFIYEQKYNDAFVDRYNFVGDHYYQGYSDGKAKMAKYYRKLFDSMRFKELKIQLDIKLLELNEKALKIEIEALIKENRLLKLKEKL